MENESGISGATWSVASTVKRTRRLVSGSSRVASLGARAARSGEPGTRSSPGGSGDGIAAVAQLAGQGAERSAPGRVRDRRAWDRQDGAGRRLPLDDDFVQCRRVDRSGTVCRALRRGRSVPPRAGSPGPAGPNARGRRLEGGTVSASSDLVDPALGVAESGRVHRAPAARRGRASGAHAARAGPGARDRDHRATAHPGPGGPSLGGHLDVDPAVGPGPSSGAGPPDGDRHVSH